VKNLIFIMLVKNTRKVTKEMIAETSKRMRKMSKEGIKVIDIYWTLGRYDGVFIFEAPNEKAAMKAGIESAETAKTETLVAIPREEAIKLLD